MNADSGNSIDNGLPAQRSQAADAAVQGIIIGSLNSVLFSEVFMGIASLVEGDGFHPDKWWGVTIYIILGSIASGITAGLGSIWIGRRKLAALEWALIGFLGGALGDWLSGPIWARGDVWFYFSVGQMIALMLAIVASTTVTAGITAWRVNRQAGVRVPTARFRVQWFVAYILGLFPIAVLVAWPLRMLSRIF